MENADFSSLVGMHAFCDRPYFSASTAWDKNILYGLKCADSR
jgi:hypothetical protein